MRINPIYSYKFQTNFSSSYNPKYKLEKGQLYLFGSTFNSDYTNYARDDINWKNFGEYLKQKYPDIQNVDINLFACSKGEEAYTLAILLEHLYKDASFKINAMDINKSTIDTCVDNQLTGEKIINFDDIKNMECRLGLTKEESEKFFINLPNRYLYEYLYIKTINPDILKRVKFQKANILTSLDIIDSSKPNIILARNMWPYVDDREYCDFADKLYRKLPKNSIMVIGGFDISGYHELAASSLFPSALYKAGFKNPFLKNCFEMGDLTRGCIFEK